MTLHIFLLIKRRPDTTREQFREYWSVNHARVFMSIKAVKENLVRYSQFHVLVPPSDVLAAAGLTVAPFDGAAEFWVEKIEDFIAVIGGEEYKKTGIPDEEQFLDPTATQVLVGDDQLKWLKA